MVRGTICRLSVRGNEEATLISAARHSHANPGRLRDNRQRIEGVILGAGLRGAPTPPGPAMWTLATIALAARASEVSIAANRRESEDIAAISGTSA